MRGSYTNISGRRCSRLCFGSSNDFIFCSTHSSTSLLRNKKRLPTKSWVSPFLHRYESLAKTTKINAWMPNNLISMTIKTKVFFREIKGDFTLWEDSNTTAAAWFSCKPSFVLLQRHRVFVVKYPPPAHSRTHFVLFTSVARVSSWIFRQMVAKSAKTVWLLVWMSGTTE